jgi:hypothetical protein
MMPALELPAPRGGNWIGVMIERHDVAGADMVAVTIRGRAGQKHERRWFTDGNIALAWGLSQADSRHLPLFDFRDAEAE